MHKPKSRFILNKIKGQKYDDKSFSYIQDLCKLERLVLEGPQGWAHAMFLHRLKQEYEKEYQAILKELDPEQFKKLKLERKQEREKEKQDKKREKKEAEQHKKDQLKWWKECGGIL